MSGHYYQVFVDIAKILVPPIRLQNVRRGVANNVICIIHTYQYGMAEEKSRLLML